MSYITCDKVTLGYDGKVVASQIQFEVNRGDYLCIVGENGAGKSTLVKTLLQLIKPMDGEFITGDGLRTYEIGYLPQQTVLQKDFPASVWEIVLSGTLNNSKNNLFYGTKEKDLAVENLKKMDIWDLKKKCYRELSGGQQQRVLLARALCATKKVILLDEPVAGLDPKVTAELYKVIKDLNDDGVTIIMISHDIQAAIDYASHILHVNGSNSFFGTTKAYLESSIASVFQENAHPLKEIVSTMEGCEKK